MRLIDADDVIETISHYIVKAMYALYPNDKMPDFDKGMIDGYARARSIVFETPTAYPVKHGRWIPCNERLPEIGDTYIVTGIQKDPHEKDWHYFVDVASSHGDYIDDYWDTFNDWVEGQETHIIAWMPLPKPCMMDEVLPRNYIKQEERNMKTTIICGFPGIGKTTCRYKYNNPNVLDMESSAYSWIFDWVNLNECPKRNLEFPNNYIDDLELFAEKGGYEYIFVSCHEEVREEMRNRGIKYIIVAPKNTPETKNEYCKRYLKRGSDVDLINKVYQDWDYMLESIKRDPSPTIWLDCGEYLADVISQEGE